MGGKKETEEEGRGTEKQEGQREEQNGDVLEEGGLSIKRSHSERAPVQRTEKS